MAPPFPAEPAYDGLAELKATDDAKEAAGVSSQVPLINLSTIAEGERRREVVDQVRRASESWGIFQVVGHGVPTQLLDEAVAATRRFHDGDAGEKAGFCFQDRDPNWRDTLICGMAPDPPQPDQLPASFRDMILEYSTHMARLGETLFVLLSEALGLRPSHLKDMQCDQGYFLTFHNYPARPGPEPTVSCIRHSDVSFISINLQEAVGGLQVLYQDQWVEAPPVPGALSVHMGDFMQLITNDRFKAVVHRVVGNRDSPRVSVGCFFTTRLSPTSTRSYGPIKELLSEENPPKYRETLVRDYTMKYMAKISTAESPLPHFKLSQ